MMKSFTLIYSAVPRINCKGKCQGSCGPIAAYPREVEHFEKATGKKFPDAAVIINRTIKEGSPMECPHLNPIGQCSVYPNRPLICRLWGVVPDMPCPWGCLPDRPMTEHEARELLDSTK